MPLVSSVLKDDTGSAVISVILGLGLAALFRRACKGGRCVVVKSPKLEELRRFVYKVDDDCYKYTPHVVPCATKPDGGGGGGGGEGAER